MNKRRRTKFYTLLIAAGFIFAFSLNTGLYAGASNNEESQKKIQKLEESESLDQELGATEGVKPKPVKKEADPEYLEEQLQGRQGFQQDPLDAPIRQR